MTTIAGPIAGIREGSAARREPQPGREQPGKGAESDRAAVARQRSVGTGPGAGHVRSPKVR